MFYDVMYLVIARRNINTIATLRIFSALSNILWCRDRRKNSFSMETKLRAILAGNRAAVTKLLTRFDELKANSGSIEVEDVKTIENAVTQKQNMLLDLNEKMIEVISDGDTEQEIADQDEYMFNLDCKLREIRKLRQTIQSNKIKDLQVLATLNADAECFVPESATFKTNTSAVNSVTFRNQPCISLPRTRKPQVQ